MKPGSHHDLPHARWVPFVLLALMWVALALLVIPTWGWTYWDFGDGNYLYVARRVREGAVLYKDILAPQPPLHTIAGVIAQSLGDATLGNDLYGARLYSLLARFAASLLVMMLALKYYRCPFRAIVAAAIYLTLPIGFWWSLGYQSENLEIIFLLGALLCLIRWNPKWAAAAGVCSALACHTNMTAMPYLVANALFLVFRRPKLLPWYLGAAISVYTVIAIGANIWTEGYFVSNVLLNQVGTFPRTDILSSTPGPPNSFLGYAWGKISSQSWEVLTLEAGMIIAAFAGAALQVRKAPMVDRKLAGEERDNWHQTEFLAWSLIAGLFSIFFTAKGGTVNYIFTIGEPMVAFFAASALVALFRFSIPKDKDVWRTFSIWDTRVFLLVLFTTALLAVVYIPMVKNIQATLNEVQTELPERRALELRGFIESYAEPGDMILAPPFYAYMTDTNVAAELAENYIWQIKWMNEQFDLENYGIPTQDGTEKMAELAGLLERQEVKVVLLDLAQTGRVPVVARAIAENYQLAEEQPYRTRNTSLGLYIPNDVQSRHVPLQ